MGPMYFERAELLIILDSKEFSSHGGLCFESVQSFSTFPCSHVCRGRHATMTAEAEESTICSLLPSSMVDILDSQH